MTLFELLCKKRGHMSVNISNNIVRIQYHFDDSPNRYDDLYEYYLRLPPYLHDPKEVEQFVLENFKTELYCEGILCKEE